MTTTRALCRFGCRCLECGRRQEAAACARSLNYCLRCAGDGVETGESEPHGPQRGQPDVSSSGEEEPATPDPAPFGWLDWRTAVAVSVLFYALGIWFVVATAEGGAGSGIVRGLGLAFCVGGGVFLACGAVLAVLDSLKSHETALRERMRLS